MNFPEDRVAEVKITSEKDGVKFKQYHVGWRYVVNVYEDGKVTIRDNSYHKPRQDDIKQTFPNLVLEEGELKFRLEDFVEIIMERMEPGPYAKLLWANNEEVKKEFIECLKDTWETGISIEDRRTILTQLKGQIHSDALDKFAYTMHKLEYDQSKNYNFFDRIYNMNSWLRDNNICDDQGNIIQFKSETEDERIGGANWNEAREFWRKEVLKQFPIGEENEHTND